MSLVARIALGVAILAVLAVGAVIFYVLPQLGAPPDAASPPPIAAAPPAPADTTAPPAPSLSGPPPLPSSQADNTPAPSLAPPAALSPASTPSPSVGYTPPTPTPTAPAPTVSEPAPSPAPAPIQSAGAPIPLAPAPSPVPAAAPVQASGSLNPAAPGAGNIAEFVNQTMTMGGTADARSAPLADAPVLTRLTKGSPVKVVGVLAGNLWLQVELPDQQTGYIPTAALPDAASPSPAPAQSAGPPAFMADSEQLTTTAPTPVYGAPNAAGAPKQVLKPGTAVQIIAKTSDGQWGWMQTPDNQEAYVQMATLSAGPPPPAVLPDTLSGHAKVVNTATLIVDGQKLQLFGIRGEGGAYAAQLRSLLESQGNVVSCHRRDTQYVCTLPGDIDIARAALFNGAARPAANAPPDYRDQAASARDAGRGVWGH